MSNAINDIFPRRLKQARLMRGYSLEKLSQALSVPLSRQAINKYEKGLMKPDSKVLIALANALEMKIDYFFRPFTVEIEKIEFLKEYGFTEKMADVVKQRVSEELERYLEIEQISEEVNPCRLLCETVMTVEEANIFAREVREKFGLGKEGISNLMEVLEDQGIKIIEIEEIDDFNGLSGYANGVIPFIAVNRNFITERKRFILLHELGHLLMTLPIEMAGKDVETMCDSFATEMLLPAESLIAKIGKSRHDISLTELTDLQQQFGISVDQIMLSLRNLGVISDRRYAGFQKKKKEMPILRNIIDQSRIEAEHPSRFRRLVYRALANEDISASKAAALLNTTVSTVMSTLQLV